MSVTRMRAESGPWSPLPTNNANHVPGSIAPTRLSPTIRRFFKKARSTAVLHLDHAGLSRDLTQFLQHFLNVLRQHFAPCFPIVGPVGIPQIDPIGNALLSQHMGDLPRLLRVFIPSLPSRQHNRASPQAVQMLAIRQSRDKMNR